MKRLTINDVSQVIKTGKTPPSKNQEYYNGDINWYTPGDINNDKSLGNSKNRITNLAFQENKAVVFSKNTLLVTCIGDIGRVGITQNTCSSNQQITGIEPNERVDVNFLFYWFIYNKPFLELFTNKAVVQILNNASLKKIPFTYCPPLETQKKIAAILDEADKLRQLDKQLIEKYDALTQSLFLDMFGDPSINKEGWSVESFGKYIDVLTDYHSNGSYKTLREHVTLKNTPDYALMVRTTDLENNNFIDNVNYIDEHAYNYLEKSKVYGGEIIINKIGSAGKVYRMPKLNRPVSLGMNAFLLRFNKSINEVFLYFQLISDYGEREIQKRVKGAVTKTIRKDAVRSIPIISPPISLQNQFAERIEAIESQKALAQQSLEKSEELFNSLLQKAFKGELV